MSSRILFPLAALLLIDAAGSATALSDPTRPPGGLTAPSTSEPPESSDSGIHLTSILHGRTSRARINGVWLRPGEEHKGVHVIRIERRHVIVRKDGERRELSLERPAAIKRPVDDKEHP